MEIKQERKRVAISGVGGAIGIHLFSHICHHTDWDVVGFDSFRADHKGYFDRIGQTLKEQPEWRERLTIFTHNLCAPFTQREIEKIGKIDYIINLASMSDVQASIYDPLPFVRNNIELMLTMLQYVREIKPDVFLHFSSDEVYGAVPKDSPGHKEWDSIVPSNPYSASKAAQEALAIAWWRSFGVPLIITNTQNNFGEMQAPSKFPAMIQQKIQRGESITIHCSGDGEIGTRHYIHSRNVADAVLFILKNVKPIIHQPGEIDLPVRLNIVGDKQVSNLELVQIIGRLMGMIPKIEMISFHAKNPGHDLHYGMSGEKLAGLGWKAPLSFEESLKRTIEWQLAHQEWIS